MAIYFEILVLKRLKKTSRTYVKYGAKLCKTNDKADVCIYEVLVRRSMYVYGEFCEKFACAQNRQLFSKLLSASKQILHSFGN